MLITLPYSDWFQLSLIFFWWQHKDLQMEIAQRQLDGLSCHNIHGHQMMNPTDFRPHWITTHLCLRPPQAFQAFFFPPDSAIIFLQEQNRSSQRSALKGRLPDVSGHQSARSAVSTEIASVRPSWRMVKITCGPMCVEKPDQNNRNALEEQGCSVYIFAKTQWNSEYSGQNVP